jgi:hypothetical protein
MSVRSRSIEPSHRRWHFRENCGGLGERNGAIAVCAIRGESARMIADIQGAISEKRLALVGVQMRKSASLTTPHRVLEPE